MLDKLIDKLLETSGLDFASKLFAGLVIIGILGLVWLIIYNLFD